MKDLVANLAIIMVFMFICGEVSKTNWLKTGKEVRKMIFYGMIAGSVGCLLLFFSIPLPRQVVLDLRQFALILAAGYGGFFSALLAGVIMATFRIIYFGMNTAAILDVFQILGISILCGLTSYLKSSQTRKWIIMNIGSMLITAIVLSITLSDLKILEEVIVSFYFMSITAGCILFYFARYIALANELYEKYKSEATKDFLTGLNNVRHFDHMVNTIIHQLHGGEQRVSILIADIDYFKKVNDTYGHLAGNIILKELAKILQNSCRRMDSISRIGGEEFCIILPKCSSEKVLQIGERIRKNVEEHTFDLLNGKCIHVTLSLGAATYPDTVNQIEQIIEEADQALYLSKKTGRNRVSLNI